MKKLKAFLRQNALWRRGLSALLAVTLVVGLLNGIGMVASAAEEEPYYGDQPESDGYYASPRHVGYTALSEDLDIHTELYDLYSRPNMISVEGSVESYTDYSRGYGTRDKIIRGRTEMVDKWKIDSFDVNFFFARTDGVYEAYRVQPIKMLLTYKYTRNNGISTQYVFGGSSRGMVTISYATSGNFVSIPTFEKSDQWNWFASKSHGINGYASDVRAVFSEVTPPKVTGWELQNRENDTPLLWLTFSEELRPVQQDLLDRELLGSAFNVDLQLTPANDPNGEIVTVRATCVEFVSGATNGELTGTGKGKLGFEIVDTDWASLQNTGKEWVIRNIVDKCDYSQSYDIWYPFPLESYYKNYHYRDKNYASSLPITDTVGNTFKLGNVSNVNVRLDNVDPYVANVFLTGDSLPAANTSSLDLSSWADVPDLDWADLFVGAEDSFYATVELNEEIKDLTAEQKAQIYLEWSIRDNDGNPLTTKLSAIRDASYVNGSATISQLVFEPLVLNNAAVSESGKQVHPVKLHGANCLQDFYNNALTDNGVHEISLKPDKQLYLDIMGPTVTLGQVIRGEGEKINTYQIQLDITDRPGTDDGRFYAGMVGGSSNVMGSFSLYSKDDIPAIGYRYALLPIGDVFEGYLHSGTLSTEEAKTPVPIVINKEGSYILYLELKSEEGMEISDESGATLDFTLWDILGNASTQTCNLTDLQLDRVAPTASAQGETVIVAGDTNYAEFKASVTASDLNGISRIEYKWGADTVFTQESCKNKKSVTFQIPAKTITGDSVVTDTLEIKVYDKYGNETVLKTLSFSGDLNKYVPQAAYTGDPNYPGTTNDIVISAPLTTGGGAAVGGYVRVVCELADGSYVIGTGQIKESETISLFGTNSLTWVSATKSENKYVNVTELENSGLTNAYGYVDVTIWVSKAALAVVENTLENPRDTSTEAHVRTAQSMTMRIARTASRNDVHNVAFGSVTLASGEAIAQNDYSGLKYVTLFPDTFAGTRYPFTISNAVMPDWSLVDVDWTNSYAVLYKATAEGTITEEEVTARIPLAAGINQSLVVPGVDKDGKAFATGVYVWKVSLAQVAGGVQEFVAPIRLLLDAVEVNAEFGVYSFANSTSLGNGFGSTGYGAYDASDPDTLYYTLKTLDQVQKNADGSPLTTINVAVAEPCEYGEIVRDESGRESYAVVPVNGNESINMKIEMDLSQLGTSTYMGQEVGVLKGFRYWNANAPVNLDALPFEVTDQNENEAYLEIYKRIDWYDDQSSRSIVVDDLSKLEPAERHKDFRLTLGKNRIAYQLQLTNGQMSDVKYFDLILRTVVPTVSVEFTPGPGRTHDISLEDGETVQQVQSTYVTAGIKDYTSVSGGINVYQLTSEYHVDRYVYALNKVTDLNNIVLTQGSHGYEGPHTQGGDEPDNRDYLLVVDEYGNGVVVYPIIGYEDDIGDARFENVIIPGLGKISALSVGNVNENGSFKDGRYELTIEHTYSGQSDEAGYISRVMDGYSVQIDNREPVYIDAKNNEHIYDDDGYIIETIMHNAHVVDGVNDAGIEEISNAGVLEFAFPYDPNQELGVDITHTITVCAYLNGKVTDTKEIRITKPNMRPSMTFYKGELGETELESFYTDLTDDAIAAGSFAPGSYAYAAVKMSGEDDFTYWHYMETLSPGNYTVEYMDKYGVWYTQPLNLNIQEDPKVTISTTEPTVGPVVITVTSESYDLNLDTVTSYKNPNYSKLAVPEGTVVEGNGTGELKITLYQNSEFTMDNPDDSTSWYFYDSIRIRYGENWLDVYVDNIYNEPVQPKINWTYTEQEVLENYTVGNVTYPKVVFGTVEAVLVDENDIPLIDPATGETPRFTFEPGGVTSHTFSSYTNIVGTIGPDITATLPVTLLEYVAPVYPEDPAPVQDVWAPNVAIYGTAAYNGDTQNVYAAYVNTPNRDAVSPIADITTDWAKGWIDAYGSDMVFDSSEDLIACFGWADAYRLNLDILDESGVKVFVTAADNGTIPRYATGRSDVIEGVNLIGRSVAVTENGTFYIHVVDEEDNVVSIPIHVTNLGEDAPTPNYALVLSKDRSQVRAYLMPPNLVGVTNLQITTGTWEPHEDAEIEENAQSMFYGMPYLTYVSNGNQTLYYSYELMGRTFTGQISFNIDSIDMTELSISAPKWSANYDPNATAENWEQSFIRMTNQNITAKFTANKTIGNVYFTDGTKNADGVYNEIIPSNVTVSHLGSQVTVEYEYVCEALKLVVVSATNGSKICVIDLPAIVTIDKSAPAIFGASVTYSENHRSAEILLKVSEEAMLQSTGKYLTKVDGEYPYYTTVQTVNANGEYVFTVVDRAGNRAEKKVTVNGLITDALTMQISTTASDEGIIHDPASYVAEVGETLYVKTVRNAKITVDHTEAKTEAIAGQWTAVTITESLSGLYPIIRAVDDYGNSAIIQLESVPLRDGNAPVVILRKSLISVPLNSTEAEMTELLKSNLLVSDETTPVDQLVFAFEYARPTSGAKVNVTYKVTDTSGNTATCTGQIRFYGEKELTVSVNGKVIERDNTVVVQMGQIDLAVESGKEPYKIMWKTGIKTVAQVKINAETLTSYTDEAKSYELPFDVAGYYTVVITTQSQDTYRIILYVED